MTLRLYLETVWRLESKERLDKFSVWRHGTHHLLFRRAVCEQQYVTLNDPCKALFHILSNSLFTVLLSLRRYMQAYRLIFWCANQHLNVCVQLVYTTLILAGHPVTLPGDGFTLMRYTVIWEQPQQIKISFMNKLRAHWSQGMLAIIRRRIFCLPVCCPKI